MMYSIDKQKAIIVRPGSRLSKNLKPIHEFDLVNNNAFDEDGIVIREALNPEDYDNDFAARLFRIQPLYRCEDFLQHHYQYTSDKSLFLKHLEFHILLFFRVTSFRPYEVRIGFIKDWIAKVKKQGSDETNSALNHVQNALYHIYEEKNLPSDCAQRLRNTYNTLNLPEGTKERRRTGEEKRSLTTRLKDFKVLKPRLSERALEKLLADENAVLEDLQRFKK